MADAQLDSNPMALTLPVGSAKFDQIAPWFESLDSGDGQPSIQGKVRSQASKLQAKLWWEMLRTAVRAKYSYLPWGFGGKVLVGQGPGSLAATPTVWFVRSFILHIVWEEVWRDIEEFLLGDDEYLGVRRCLDFVCFRT